MYMVNFAIFRAQLQIINSVVIICRNSNQNNKYNGGDGKWAGQEGQFLENSEKGINGLVVNECWLPHVKERGWTRMVGK